MFKKYLSLTLGISFYVFALYFQPVAENLTKVNTSSLEIGVISPMPQNVIAIEVLP